MIFLEDIAIREAGPDDVGRISEIHILSWRAAYKGIMPDHVLARLDVSQREEGWRRIFAQPGLPCLIACSGFHAAGFIHMSASRDPDRDPVKVGEITAIYLDPACWRKGIGTMLVDAAMKQLFNNGFTEIDLWVLERNMGARSFYEKLGFRADGGMKTYPGSNLAEMRYSMTRGDASTHHRTGSS
jgi:ribosomal protein S18 acetylase RimI-like enzyme